jgi:hypothetical protein
MTLSARSYLLCSGLVACLVVGAAWLYTSLMPMRFLEGGYPIWVAKQAILRDCSFGSVLVMGDSRPESAINPMRLGLPAANIASGAVTPIEDYFFARRAVKCPKRPRFVVYSHSLLSFASTSEYLWKNAARYDFIAFRDLRDIARTAEELHDDSLPATNTHDGLAGIVRDVVYSASLLKARGIGRYAANIALLRQTAAQQGGVTYPDRPGNTSVGADAQVTSFAALPIQAYYFDKTLELFAAAGVEVLVVPIPVSRSTMNAMPVGSATNFATFLAQHTGRFANVVASYPTITAWPDDLFVDGSHLNERGATIFSARLAACLSQSPGPPVPCDLAWK